MSPTASVPAAHFDALYAADPDPWQFATSPYEQDKYASTLEALPRPHYRRAFEPGCSIGVFTAMLAPRCDLLIAADVSEAALDGARQRVGHLPQVRLMQLEVPAQMPAGRFDLIVLAELGYYWSSSDLRRARVALTDALEPGGHLVLVHYTPFVAHHPLRGDDVHGEFLAASRGSRLVHLQAIRRPLYRIDTFLAE